MEYSDYLQQHTGCPFCKREQPTLAQNENAYLTIALAPYHKHHLLVVPKRHFEKVSSITDIEASDIWALQKVGMRALTGLGYDTYTIMVRQGKDSGKTVGHLHYHIVPDEKIGDLENPLGKREILNNEELHKYSEEIKKILTAS